MLKTRLKIEARELDFEFEVLNVQFNELGNYVLWLTVENPLLEDSGTGVQLRVNDGEVLYTSTGTTDVIQQSSLDEVYTCLRCKFVFTLPQGFCKMTKPRRRLKIEALRVPDSQVKNGTKVGEAFFAIYPRTNTPESTCMPAKMKSCTTTATSWLCSASKTTTWPCTAGAWPTPSPSTRPGLPLTTPTLPPACLPSRRRARGGQTALSPSPAPSTLSVPPLIPEPTRQQDPEKPEPESERRSSPESMLESPSESLPPTPDGGLLSSRPHRRPTEASLHFPSPQDTPGQSPEPLPATHVSEAACRDHGTGLDGTWFMGGPHKVIWFCCVHMTSLCLCLSFCIDLEKSLLFSLCFSERL
ncbi:coiled-coil domain-containing protein 33-like [Acipenser oxyrinchus oxyrinchus]|uniref:Coiled-coil domain-containing protein 33-like n=1 Tax=Acipenser oxyrinchus oxyrinchus TaxID=40147 RepID=A0AAD8D0I4_ACIOX|nr:coiled-coil domain-containing protein 33-like [Acipenser oxyrinchus oxyrinchus]